MDALVAQCSRLTVEESSASSKKDWYDNTSHGLYCVVHGGIEYVYSIVDIHPGEFIGYITGERKYSWEVLPHRYCIWLNDSYVIDCGATPRCITSMIRETYDKELRHNCELAYAYTSETIDVYVVATQKIYRGEELIIQKDCMEDSYYY